MTSIFNLALMLFALVVLPAAWYYSRTNGKHAENLRPFISNLEKTIRQKTKNDVVAGVIVLIMLLSIIILIEFGVI
ncbi:MAG: hypothetical protein AB2591_18245 [Candidatus Thiodiazotropha sp.]